MNNLPPDMSRKHAHRPSQSNHSQEELPFARQPNVPLPSHEMLQRAQKMPTALASHEVMTLQRSMGNRAVAHMLNGSSVPGSTLQRDSGSQTEAASGAAGGQLSSPLESEISRSRGSGQRLDAKTSANMGSAFGKDFGGVKIHTDAKADTLSRAINANAFTVGNDIYFRKNQYAPTSGGGQKLLAHELTHVVQQTGASNPGIQTKLSVGAAHDRFEQEADSVAAQVTERIAARPQTKRKDDAASDDAHESAQERASIAPVQVQLKRNNGVTIARSYQERAVQFEQSLGRYAFQHPKANAAAKAMTDHIQKYITRKAKEEGSTEKKIDQLWQKAGGHSKSIAGSVGEKIEDIKEVFAKGNLRERMTHAYNFMEHHFGNVGQEDVGPLEEISRGGNRVYDQFVNFFQRTGQDTGIYFGDVLHKSAPKAGPLQEQRQIREHSGEDSRTKLTVKDVGLDEEGGMLSKREARMMFGDIDDPKSLKDKQLEWSEGARAWKINKNHEWSQMMQVLDMPVMAGPSAHTNAFMNIATLFGIKDLASVRLATIGHLLPINAHSLVEIMAAAAGHGVDFTPGPEMYRAIKPLSNKELRNQVGKGSFPDEFGSPETGSGGDYKKLTEKFREVMKLFAVPPDQADPQRQVAKLTDLDQAALKHIASKQKEKAKLKAGKTEEAKRLDVRIQAVGELREHIKSKLKIANKSLKLDLSRKRIQELSGSKEYNDKLFHGTHTGLLAGLTKSEGTLISAHELDKRGIVRSTGEGDFFSNGLDRGPKQFISVGLGEFGMGTALAYAQAAGTLPNYNIERYKDEELALETHRLREAINAYDETLIDLDKTEREFKSKAQLQNLLDRLDAEVNLRSTLPPAHPRRRGELSDDSNFPLLFEFVGQDLDVRDEGGYSSREKLSMEMKTYNTEMMGERMVYGGTIDLKPLIRRVYCPVDKIDEVTQKLTGIFGHSDFEVLAIEALIEMPTSTPIGGIRNETYTMQMEFEDVRKNVVSGYAQGMKSKQKISDLRKLAKEYGTLPPPKSQKDSKDDQPVVGQQDEQKEVKQKSVDQIKDVSTRPEDQKDLSGPPTTKSAFQQNLDQAGLRLHRIKGDGNCLFAAVVHQLGLQGLVYKTPMALRLALSQHILQSSTQFQQRFLAPIFAVEGLSVQDAAARIRSPGYWSGLVGDTAPQLLANLLERTIILHRTDGSVQSLDPMGENKHAPIAIVYNGANHYDSTAPLDVSGPVSTTIQDQSGNITTKELVSPPKSLDKEGSTSPLQSGTQDDVKSTESITSSPPTKDSTDTKVSGGDHDDEKGVPKPLPNLLTEDSPPLPKPKKGKPRVVLSGHGLLRETTSPTKTKVPSNMSITFTGPMGSILDNPLANMVEQGQLRPEDIFMEAADLHTGDVTEIEPHEIMKLYKIFGPRTVKEGKMAPNYTLTSPKTLEVSVNDQVFTVSRDHTLAEIFPILRKIYPKGVNVYWAACQDLPGIDRRFQIKIMDVKDRFVAPKGYTRATTSGEGRKHTLKLISKMVKDFKSI